MFTPKQVRHWRRAAFREIQQLGFIPGHREFSAGMVTAAVYCFGTDIETLCTLTGYSAELVGAVLKRLRKTRILVGQTMRVAWDDPGLRGPIAVTCDVLTAAGVVDRPADPERSAAHVGRHSGPRKPRTPSPRVVGAFTPKVVKSDPLYEIAKSGK